MGSTAFDLVTEKGLKAIPDKEVKLIYKETYVRLRYEKQTRDFAGMVYGMEFRAESLAEVKVLIRDRMEEFCDRRY